MLHPRMLSNEHEHMLGKEMEVKSIHSWKKLYECALADFLQIQSIWKLNVPMPILDVILVEILFSENFLKTLKIWYDYKFLFKLKDLNICFFFKFVNFHVIVKKHFTTSYTSKYQW